MSGYKFSALLATVFAGTCLAGVPAATADELSDANALVLADPGNIELSLQYAQIAEAYGEYRLALAAYERILLNHPDDSEAKRGQVRVARIIQPPTTRTFVEAGIKAESNAEHVPDPSEFDFLGFGRVTVRDERTLGETRWRTFGSLYGEVHSESETLNYASARATMGPIFDIGTSLVSLHPAIGGAVAALDDGFYYVEVNASATIDNHNQGAFRWLRLRGGYRQYEEDLTSDNGFYLDATARFAKTGIFSEKDGVSFTPIVHWNEIDGTFNDNVNDFSPGKYVFGGARLAYYRSLNDLITFGASVGIYDRYFLVDLASNGDNRNDFMVKPGVHVLFKDVFGDQTGVRLSYDYEYNESNDSDYDYQNHIIGLSVIARR